MNKAKLKSYAPQARNDFIAAVTARAHLLGLSEKGGKLEVALSQTQGDVTVIAGQAWPAKVDAQRNQLIARIQKDGFAHTMEAVAYTWFNRFAALRYMELHDYLGHGHRALSSAEGTLPDLLTHAADLAQSGSLPGLNAPKVLDLKLAGNRDGELYRMLLVAQCNALSRAMPFLFERIDDDSELLLPDNLLRSDSVIAKLVEAIPEEDWAEVEIIGWLYQFYISEKKDQVIGKVVKSEDIPAATQLFTPNWIVQYLVQNSVGRLWLMANPQSTLAQEWTYYITPAEQTPEVQAQLDALIQTRVREDGDTLNPESITVLDPACGSGHILVVAYDVLKAIYLERGYQPRAIPRLILEKNLFGLDIDDRAAQMAGFALLMKARADDRRLFTATDEQGNLQPPKLNVLSLQESKGLSVDELATHLAPFKVQRATITALVDTFEHAKTFGSLIQIPYALKTHLAVLPEVLALVKQSGDMYASAAAHDLLPLVKQAQMLAMQFDAVVANPPYMGSGGMNATLKKFAQNSFSDSKRDLFACFIERSQTLTKGGGFSGMITMDAWLFLSSYVDLRNALTRQRSFDSLVHIGWNCFPEVHTYHRGVAFVLFNGNLDQRGRFLNLSDVSATVDKNELFLSRLTKGEGLYSRVRNDFDEIPGSPVAYWVTGTTRRIFVENPKLGSLLEAREGMATGSNDKFLRYWTEVSISSIGFGNMSGANVVDGSCRWFPYQKGGAFRRWFGNAEYVVNWFQDGEELKRFSDFETGRIRSHNYNGDYAFRVGITWSAITSGTFSARIVPQGFMFDAKGPMGFASHGLLGIAGLLNSKVINYFLKILSPTLDFKLGQILNSPLKADAVSRAQLSAASCEQLSRHDWDSYERSWGFQSLPILTNVNDRNPTLKSSYSDWIRQNLENIAALKRLEEENNAIFIEAYELSDELLSDVSTEQVTLTVNPAYRYGGKVTEEVQWTRFRTDTATELVSYAIGCMMGRYSLDEPGLIYANAGNVGFEPGRYANFPADADGIVPITDELWFKDDAPSRIREFLRAVWGADTLEENMAWLAESLGQKPAETPDETIRRYIADKFFKDHLQTYKKRPIYWLFSSGKQGAFQALVYLHRYHEGTLARLRAEHVVPLTGKIQSRIEILQKDADAAPSTAARNKLAKEVEKLKKKHVELLAYDEQLRHHADMRIKLDLDDGVKVNYGKFGELLAEVKAVTGGASDD